MAGTRNAKTTLKHFPVSTSVSMIIFAVALSFVDLLFLNDIIGEVLDIGPAESMVISFGLGLVGISIMAVVGVAKAHGQKDRRVLAATYALWFSIGLAFALTRVFSITILQLDDTTLENEAVTTIFGLDIRQADLVFGPVMLLLYIATGVITLEGMKNLYANPDFEKWRNERKQQKADQRNLREKAIATRIVEIAKERARRLNEIISRKKAIEAAKNQQAREKIYFRDLKRYLTHEQRQMEEYKKISRTIEEIVNSDKMEQQFEKRIKPGFQHIVDSSIKSVQNEVVLIMNKQNGAGNIAELRSVVSKHNEGLHEHVRKTS